MINSCCKLNFYFPKFSGERFINHWEIQPSNTCNYIFIFFVVHSITIMYNSCFAVCKFSFCTFCTRDAQHQKNPVLQDMQTLSVPLLYIFCHSHVQLSNHWMQWLTKNTYRELSCFFRTSQLFHSLAFRLPKVHAFSHVKQNH